MEEYMKPENIQKLPQAPKKSPFKIIAWLRAKKDIIKLDVDKVNKFFKRANTVFIIIFLFCAISILYMGFNWKSLLLSASLYFLYQEILFDIKSSILVGKR